jgi:hypothetical protein
VTKKIPLSTRDKKKNTIWAVDYTGGIREPFTLPIEPTLASEKPPFLSRTEVDEESVIGALIREPELVR